VDCLWGGGRTGLGNSATPKEVFNLMEEFKISARLVLKNSGSKRISYNQRF